MNTATTYFQMNNNLNDYKISQENENKLLLRLAKILTYPLNTYKEVAFQLCSSKDDTFVIRLNMFSDNYVSGNIFKINRVSNDITDQANFTFRGIFNPNDFLRQIIQNRLLHKYNVKVTKICTENIVMTKLQYRIQKYNESLLNTSAMSNEEPKTARRRSINLKRKEEVIAALNEKYTKQFEHLIEPKNDSERKQAELERKIFSSPSMWVYKL